MSISGTCRHPRGNLEAGSASGTHGPHDANGVHGAVRPTQRPSLTQVLGELLLTAGALLLLFAFYESFWTNIASGRLQNDAQANLEQRWHDGDDPWVNPRERRLPAPGDAFARMFIPAFGPDYVFAIVEGVDEQQLLAGPGRYPDTQLPGEPGNFAVAGHRVGKGAPFNDLAALRACDAIVVETRSSWVTYRVLPMETGSAPRRAETAACLAPPLIDRVVDGDYAGVLGRHITLPGDVNVLNPMPESPSTEVTEGLAGMITLTTCHPQFSNAERMIIHAIQTEVTPKTGENTPPPAALTETK